MEIKILEETAKRMVFQLVGSDHTFCNTLKKALLEVSGVSIATYAIEHPQIGIPKFVVETTTGKPSDALKKAVDIVTKQNKAFVNAFTKAVK
ncbi:DNA-directed RNA polymerase subunit L [Candidatus Woesearchaeota archaeon]|nr:DNA-directed RNA polymerase subunit L [Candidatus Woesearchaeota archaeon]